MYKDSVTLKKLAKARKRKRIKKKIKGTIERPRVCIFKSNRHMYAQVIDDNEGRIIASASTLEKEIKAKIKNTKNTEASKILGEILAKRLKQKKLENIVFDRGTCPYHGRIKTLAEAMRNEGLTF